jgi:hypothetical protein
MKQMKIEDQSGDVNVQVKKPSSGMPELKQELLELMGEFIWSATTPILRAHFPRALLWNLVKSPKKSLRPLDQRVLLG